MISEMTADSIAKPEVQEHRAATIQPYLNPYLAGVGLGFVLLTAFVIMGRGLGASGAFTTVITWILSGIAPTHVAGNPYFKEYLGDGSSSILNSWLVWECIGVIAGGMISGVLAGRLKLDIDHGPRVTHRTRYSTAFLGAMLMGMGAKLALGCTSGQALTGGAVLGLGSWAFMFSVFGGGYAVAYFVRRLWI